MKIQHEETKNSEIAYEDKKTVLGRIQLKKAMELAGYSPSTIEHNANLYMKKLDLDELRRGLGIKAALSGTKAFKVLDEEMDGKEPNDRIKVADVALKLERLIWEKRKCQLR
ncbi:MAG: hypothetical protein GTN76_00245 [Candidatus Aenigmarchaeota archaeon]|nr:hypothetical protein [Candidatus Aenigmarchaeota archaeon]